MNILKTTIHSLLIGIATLFLFNAANAQTEFISIIDPDDAEGTDFTALSSWESNIQSDLSTTTTQVFSYEASSASSSILANYAMTGASSGATADVIWVTASSGTSQILVDNVSGTFLNGERIYYNSDTSLGLMLSSTGTQAIAVAKCRSTGGSPDTTNVTIDGWTTASTTYVKIWTDPTDPYGRHKGKWDEGKYRIFINDSDGLLIYENYVIIDGLQVSLSGSDSTSRYAIYIDISALEVNETVLSNNIIKQAGSIGSGRLTGVYIQDQYSNSIIYNNIIYDFVQGDMAMGIDVNSADTVDIYGNTIYNTDYGIFRYTSGGSGNKVVTVKNNIINECINACFINYGGGSFTNPSNNISSDVTAPGTNSLSSTTVQFLDATNNDFHLSPNDTSARDAGINLFHDATSSFSADIDGTSRGAAWDIGADEVPVEFVSTICESTTSGGDCDTDMDYSRLYDWELYVDSDLTASTTRVFSGYLTGEVENNGGIAFYDNGVLGITGTVVATTSDQILIRSIAGTSTPVTVASGTQLRADSSNYWTITGTGDDLGASPIAVAKIDGSWTASDTLPSYLYINGWTTDNDNYIKIYTTDSARHKGKWDNNKYRIQYTMQTTWDRAIAINEEYVRIDGLQVYFLPDGYTGAIGINVFGGLSQNSDIHISNNIVRSDRTANPGVGIYFSSENATHRLYNNIVYDVNNGLAGDGIQMIGKTYAYNNTVFRSHRGFWTNGGDFTLVNNAGFDNSDADYRATTYNNNSTNNVSSDSSASQATLHSGITNIIPADEFVNVATGTEDIHLKESSSLINAGFDIAASSTLSFPEFTTDIDSAPRNPDDLGWDIGADEFPAKQYRSVGNDTSDLSNGGTVTISGRTATFSTAQPDNVGVGDVIQFGGSGYYDLAFISGRSSSTEYTVQAWDTKAPTATTSASFAIYRAHLLLDDWEDQIEGDVNDSISNTVSNKVLVNMNLEASNTIMMVSLFADALDTDSAEIQGWTTEAQNYIKVYTPINSNEVGISQRHTGKWGDGYMRTATLQVEDNYVKVEGISSKSSSFQFEINNIDIEGDVYISNCFAHYTGDDYHRPYDFWNLGAINGYLWNNIGITDSTDDDSYIFYSNDSDITLYVINNTGIAKNGAAFRRDHGNYYSKNNLAFVYGTGLGFSGTMNEVDHSASNDGTADDYGGSGNLINQNFKFWDEANHDYHLAPNSPGIDAGTTSIATDVAGQPLVVNDIDGKPIHTYDIGADDASVNYVASVMESGGDYSTLSDWETGIQTDLTATTTLAFDTTGYTGSLADDVTVTGQTSGATANLVHISSTTDQVLLENIAGTFVSGEEISDGNGTTTLSDAGNYPIAVAKIDGAWASADTSAVTIQDWTTGKYNYIKIYTTETARHNGKWDENKYRLVVNLDWNAALETLEDYIIVDGLQIEVMASNQDGISSVQTSNRDSSELIYSNNIIRTENTANTLSGIYMTSNITCRVNNNIIYGFGWSGIRGGAWDNYANYYVYNNTVFDSERGYANFGNYTNTNVELYNNIAQNNNVFDFSSTYIYYNTSNNISSDKSISDNGSKS